MGYYLGAPHVDTPLKGVRTNLLFLTAGNAATTFLAGPALYNNAEADRLYAEGEIFNHGLDAVSKNWILYLEKRFVFFFSFSACVLTFFCRYGFLLTNPDAFEEKCGLFSVFPFWFNRTAVGDIPFVYFCMKKVGKLRSTQCQISQQINKQETQMP
jgi:hypothetical protein